MKNGIFLALALLSGSAASAMPCDVSSVWLTCRSKTYTLKAQYCSLRESLRSFEVQGEGLSPLEQTSEWDGAAFYGLQAMSPREGQMILLEMNRQTKKAVFTLYATIEEDGSWVKQSTEAAHCGYASDDEVMP